MKESNTGTMKIGVVGAGKWGQNHIKTLYQMNQLGCIIESNTHTQTLLKSLYPNIPIYNSLTDKGALDCQAYSVVVPAQFHFQVAKFLLENNKHILVEKPITLDSKDAQALNELAHKNKCILLTGHLLLFHPAFKKIKELIQEGKLGKLEYLYSNRLNLGTVRTEENSLWSFAPHDISLFQFFVGFPPEKVVSEGGAFLQPSIHDTTLTTIYYPNNIVSHIFVSWLHPFKEHRFVVIGTKGMVSFEDSSTEKHLLFYEKGIDWINGEPVKRDGIIKNIEYEKLSPLEEELKHFTNCIQTQNFNSPINGIRGQEVLEILEKAQLSLENKTISGSISTPTPQEKAFFSHDTAFVDPSAKIGNGTKIWNFSNVQKNASIGTQCILGQNVNVGPNVKIGNKCKIQNNVSVYEGVELEDYVFCGPSMVFTNIMMPRSKYPQADSKFYKKTLIKEGASIGANATIVCGTTLGKASMVGAGSVVIRDVPDFALVVGNPARIIGWVSEAGTRLEFNSNGKAFCEKSGKWYQKNENSVEEIINTVTHV